MRHPFNHAVTSFVQVFGEIITLCSKFFLRSAKSAYIMPDIATFWICSKFNLDHRRNWYLLESDFFLYIKVFILLEGCDSAYRSRVYSFLV